MNLSGIYITLPWGVCISVFCIYIGVDPLDIWEVKELIDHSVEPYLLLPTSFLAADESLYSLWATVPDRTICIDIPNIAPDSLTGSMTAPQS